MASVNKVILVGNLGGDPEVRYTQNGDAVCNFSLATSETWKDKATGERREATEWHKCVAFRRLGEVAGEYLKKGSSVYVEGHLTTRKWQDKDGQDRYTTEIVVDALQMLGSRGGDANPQGGRHTSNQGSGNRNSGQPMGGQRRQESNSKKPSFDDLGDDFPF